MADFSDKRLFSGQAEDFAAEWLIKKKFRIVCRNFRAKFAEIDIIAEKGRELYFVEVKARRSFDLGSALEAVGKYKLKKIAKAAELFLMLSGHDFKNYDLKIAVIGISYYDSDIEIDFIEDITL